LVSVLAPVQARAADIAKWFEGRKGAFVLYERGANRYVRHDAARCATRFSPCSTFKIPNALIGLEKGVVQDADTVMHWTRDLFYREGRVEAPYDTWMRDNTLRSAMQNSVLWYFQQIARQVGEAGYKKALAELDYGNRDISAGLDRFWLSSSLEISADEQVEFLKKLQAGTLSASPRSMRIVREILVLEDTPAYRLSAKTGTGQVEGGQYLGWFVGYVERGDDVSVFALNIHGPTYESVSRERRIEMTKGILKDLGVLP
jgi:beta-lactamase class D